MSVSWNAGDTSAHKIARKAANASGEFDPTVKEWEEYTDLREALIWALLIVKFPPNSGWGITESNWREIYSRLYILEHATDNCYRVYNVPDKDDPTRAGRDVRKVYFTPAEIHSMIGMTVNAGNLSSAKFKTYIWNRLQEIPSNKLERFDAEL